MNELKPCPFCGRGGSIRIKTQIESFEYRDEGKVKLYLDLKAAKNKPKEGRK